MTLNKWLEDIKDNVIFLVGRNQYGNIVHIEAPMTLEEKALRYFEKEVLRTLNRRVTVFWVKKGKIGKDYTDIEAKLDFDAKFPYDAYPLQGFIEILDKHK